MKYEIILFAKWCSGFEKNYLLGQINYYFELILSWMKYDWEMII